MLLMERSREQSAVETTVDVKDRKTWQQIRKRKRQLPHERVVGAMAESQASPRLQVCFQLSQTLAWCHLGFKMPLKDRISFQLSCIPGSCRVAIPSSLH